MCTGFTRHERRYFMKASPVRPGDFIEFFAEIDLIGALSACPGGDCGASYSSDAARCYPLKVEIFRRRAETLQGWRPQPVNAYSGGQARRPKPARWLILGESETRPLPRLMRFRFPIAGRSAAVEGGDRFRAASDTSSTARSKGSAFACEGLEKPLTYARTGARRPGSPRRCGRFKIERRRMLRHMRPSQGLSDRHSD